MSKNDDAVSAAEELVKQILKGEGDDNLLWICELEVTLEGRRYAVSVHEAHEGGKNVSEAEQLFWVWGVGTSTSELVRAGKTPSLFAYQFVYLNHDFDADYDKDSWLVEVFANEDMIDLQTKCDGATRGFCLAR